MFSGFCYTLTLQVHFSCYVNSITAVSKSMSVRKKIIIEVYPQRKWFKTKGELLSNICKYGKLLAALKTA